MGMRHLPLLFAAMLAASCGQDGSSDHDMHADVDELDAHMAMMSSGVDEHADDMMAATDLPSARAAEDTHGPRGREHMAAMDGVMGRMGRDCRHMSSGAEVPMHAMRGAMDAARTEHERHVRAAREAADLPAHHAEEQRHRGAMHEALGSMRGAAEHMRTEAGTYRCNRRHGGMGGMGM
jgi:hypothetical protein